MLARSDSQSVRRSRLLAEYPNSMRVLAQLGWRIAQQPDMPKYNTGDQFAEVRKK